MLFRDTFRLSVRSTISKIAIIAIFGDLEAFFGVMSKNKSWLKWKVNFCYWFQHFLLTVNGGGHILPPGKPRLAGMSVKLELSKAWMRRNERKMLIPWKALFRDRKFESTVNASQNFANQATFHSTFPVVFYIISDKKIFHVKKII